MRATLFLLGCLSASAVASDYAEGQSQLDDPKIAINQYFWPQLYGSGGSTLYCGKSFTKADNTLIASPVYSTQQLKGAMRCITDRQCTIMNPRFPYIVSDLHNYYPALSTVEQARRNTQFTDLPANAPSKFSDIGCEFKASFKQVEPRDSAKGNIARALLYMHTEYDLPLPSPLAQLKQWNEMDPPDAEERARNDKIAAIQGSRNRFIDNPSLVDQLADD